MTDTAGADDTDRDPDTDPAVAETVDLSALVERVPEGWTEVAYRGHAWGLSRTDRAEGRTTTLYAEELGGPGFVSANVWRTSGGEVLRPCEMPAAAVVDFLRSWTPAPAPSGNP